MHSKATAQVVCNALLKEAFRQLGAQTSLLNGELKRHRGSVFEAAPVFQKMSLRMRVDAESFLRVIHSFYYQPFPQLAKELIERLQTATIQLTEIERKFYALGRPTVVERIESTFKPLAAVSVVDLENEFITKHGDLSVLIDDLQRELFDGERISLQIQDD